MAREDYVSIMTRARVNGIDIEYEDRGDGDPILFIMGLGGQLIDWPDDFIDLFLEAGYRTIRHDNRDIGLSSQTEWTPPKPTRSIASIITRRPLRDVGYTVEDMSADAAGLLDALAVDSAHIIGMSMGGMIAQALAINHPTKVRSMCSIMSNTGDRRNGGISASIVRKFARRPEPTIDNAVEQSVETFRAIAGPHFDETVHRDRAEAAIGRSFTPEGMARQTAAISGSPDRTARLTGVTAPTLVIHGLLDPLVKPSGGIATAKAIPSSRLLMFPDMGHDLPRPRWVEIRDAIIANFERADLQVVDGVRSV